MVTHIMQKWLFPVYRQPNQIRQSRGHGSTGGYLLDLPTRNRSNPRESTDGVPPHTIASALLPSVPNQIRAQRERTLHRRNQTVANDQSDALPERKPPNRVWKHPAPTHQMDPHDPRESPTPKTKKRGGRTGLRRDRADLDGRSRSLSRKPGTDG